MLKRLFQTTRPILKSKFYIPKPFIVHYSSILTKETSQDQILHPTTGEAPPTDIVAIRRLYEQYGNPEQVEGNVFAALLPPIEVEGSVAKCSGDDFSPHPVEFIKVFHEYPQECKYCGREFIRKDKH